MNILVVGDTEDLTATYISWRARQRGWRVLELREDQLGQRWSLCFDDQRPRQGHIESNGNRLGMNAIDGCYVRLCPEPELPQDWKLPAQERAAFVIERRHALQFWLNNAPFSVVNRPCAGRSNGAKPYQMEVLSQAGFQVPKWLITNEFHALSRFEESLPDGAIYKACSGLRSRVRRVDLQLKQRMALGTTPVVAQQYIPGRDVRIHLVHGQAYATTVKAQAQTIDYRFESEGNEFLATEAPPRLIERCRAMAKQEGLAIAGFDFRVTADARWYCLEVNPVPTFLPYEMATKQPIANAILDHWQASHEQTIKANVTTGAVA